MSGDARVFLALWPRPDVRADLGAWRDGWRWPRGATPVRTERLHLTLHFIGNVDARRLPELADALRVPFQPFDLRFGTPLLWEHGIAVLEPETLPERLLALHAALCGALGRCALAPDTRAFRPHVTLARRAAGAQAPEQGPPIRWRIRSYALMQSAPGAAGGYTLLRRYT